MNEEQCVCVCARAGTECMSTSFVSLEFEREIRTLTRIDGVAAIDTKRHADGCNEQAHGQRLHAIADIVIVVANGENTQH